MRMHNPPHPGEVLKTLCLEPLHLSVTEAAKALGQRGNADTIPKLAELLDDDHTAVRTMAAASMIRLSSRGSDTARR